jgi:hypothetical protein
VILGDCGSVPRVVLANQTHHVTILALRCCLKAAHLESPDCVSAGPAFVGVAWLSTARFLPKRSVSSFNSFSFLLAMPRLIFMLCTPSFLTTPDIAALLLDIVANCCSSSGNASTRDSSVVTRVLLGRRLFFFRFLSLDFRTLEIRRECLMLRVSFLVVLKVEEGVGTEDR